MRYSIIRQLIVVFIATLAAALVSCSHRSGSATQGEPHEIIVAAAANLSDVFEAASQQFTARTGIRATLSFGSTAELAKQIENGAPFDVFAAADVSHVDELDSRGFIVPESRAIYARGVLVLWTLQQGGKLKRVEDVASPDVGTISIAKPDVAPYGKAAVETLQFLNLWPQVEPKVVYAMNVSQAKQYAASGNADAAFIPLSLVRPGEGSIVELDEKSHQPIDQAVCVIKTSGKQENARRFINYLLSDEGQALLQKYGYRKAPSD